MSAPRKLSSLKWPLFVLMLLCVPVVGWQEVVQLLGGHVTSGVNILRHVLSSGLWIAGAWLLVRLIDVVVWEGLVAPRLGGKVPRLLKDVVATLIFAVATTTVLAVVFDLDVTGFWATSGVVTFVLGMALQSMIADVASGIALNVDRPFRLGDWVQVFHRKESFIGEVLETSWRSTRLRCVDGTMVIVPNGQVALYPVRNLTWPRQESRFTLTFHLDFGVPADRALRILHAGVKSAEGVLTKPPPRVRINGASKSGVEYEIRYWLDPAAVSPSKGRHRVMQAVLRHLHKAGLTLAYEKQDVYHAPMPQRQLDTRDDREAIIGRVELFADLEPAELGQLASSVALRSVTFASDVVKAGDEGDSMYIVVEGLLGVYVNGNGAEIQVGRIEPGEFFGEMSLLTGEPRSATVRASTDVVAFEVRKADLEPLLRARPELAEQITAKVAERKVRSLQRTAEHAASAEQVEEEAENLAAQLLGKVKSLFF